MLDHIDDRPGQKYAILLRDYIPFIKEMYFESGRQQDSIAVWLVGMSTGAIALIISQFRKFDPALYPILKWSVTFLTITIMLGLLFRMFQMFLQKRERSNLIRIQGWLAGYSLSSTFPLGELPEDASIEFIVRILYHHMGIDIDSNLIKKLVTENDAEYWKDRYKAYAKWSQHVEKVNQQDVKNMLEGFFEFIANLEGEPPQKYEQTSKTDKSAGVRYRRIRKICTFSYTLMCISFAISVLFISWGFIKTDLKVNHSSASTNQKVIAPSEQVQPTQVDKSD